MTRQARHRGAEAGVTPGKGSFGALVLAIWALPGIGIPTLLLLLQRRKRSHDRAATPNKRGQYG